MYEFEVKEVRRAIVKTCMKSPYDITSPKIIGAITAQALMGLGTMSVAGYKAAATRRKQSLRRRLKK